MKLGDLAPRVMCGVVVKLSQNVRVSKLNKAQSMPFLHDNLASALESKRILSIDTPPDRGQIGVHIKALRPMLKRRAIENVSY
jgi:hypothetical protein